MVVRMGGVKWLWAGEVKWWWDGMDMVVVGKVGRVGKVVVMVVVMVGVE